MWHFVLWERRKWTRWWRVDGGNAPRHNFWAEASIVLYCIVLLRYKDWRWLRMWPMTPLILVLYCIVLKEYRWLTNMWPMTLMLLVQASLLVDCLALKCYLCDSNSDERCQHDPRKNSTCDAEKCCTNIHYNILFIGAVTIHSRV